MQLQVADVRIILSIALKLLATSFIIAHNHPGGNIKPSRSDEVITEKLEQPGKILDIKLPGHFIVAPTRVYFSFADEGII